MLLGFRWLYSSCWKVVIYFDCGWSNEIILLRILIIYILTYIIHLVWVGILIFNLIYIHSLPIILTEKLTSIFRYYSRWNLWSNQFFVLGWSIVLIIILDLSFKYYSPCLYFLRSGLWFKNEILSLLIYSILLICILHFLLFN